MGERYNWTVHVDHGAASAFRELAVASAPSLDDALSAAHRRVAHDICEVLSFSQEELKRVAADFYQTPSEPYGSPIEEALNEHEAPYAHHRAGIEYLRQLAAVSSAESVVNDDHSRWWTSDRVKDMATTDSGSDHSVRQTVYLHAQWRYSIHVDAND